jgi:hypothetical protein
MSEANYDDLAAEFQNVWDQNAGVLEAVSLLDSDDPDKEALMAEVNGIFDSLEDMRSQYALDVEVA